MLTPVEAVTLAALADRPRYGYELVQRISALTDGRLIVRPGNLYRVIDRLMSEGYVTETEQVAVEGDERRRWFKLTKTGAAAAVDELSMYGQVLNRTPALRKLMAHG